MAEGLIPFKKFADVRAQTYSLAHLLVSKFKRWGEAHDLPAETLLHEKPPLANCL